MTELSPAAQAVFEAAWTAYWLKDAEHPADAELIAAAALRAAVAHTEQLHGHDLWECDADKLLAIADELEGGAS